MTPRFSVIVPTYGRPQMLDDAVASVLSQTIDDLECIVVDDASPDPVTVDRDERVRVVRRDHNGGPGAARNTGVELARGRYLAFLDDDDWWVPDRLEIALEGLARAPVALCFGRYHDEPDEGKGRRLDGDVANMIRDGMTPHAGVTAITRDAWVPFDETLTASADVEWWIRLAHAGTVATVPRVGCVIRHHDGVRHGNDTPARLEALKRIRVMHADYFANHRRADGFQLFRIGMQAAKAGDRAQARTALLRSFRRYPRPAPLYFAARATVLKHPVP
jgi:glycosyltransferase involved in cell wall biosynthesis